MGVVIIEWQCVQLTEKQGKRYIIRAYPEAIYSTKHGWICDCGRWTTGDDIHHIPLRRGFRDEG